MPAKTLTLPPKTTTATKPKTAASAPAYDPEPQFEPEAPADSSPPFEPTFPADRKPRYSLNFWKPYQGKGAAALLDFNPQKGKFFITMMPEKPGDGREFDSSRRITSTLGLTDVGEFLLVLNGRADGVGPKDGEKYKGLFHKNQRGNTAINFAAKENGGFWFGVSSKVDNNEAVRYNVSLTNGESEQLKLFLTNPLHPIFAQPDERPE